MVASCCFLILLMCLACMLASACKVARLSSIKNAPPEHAKAFEKTKILRFGVISVDISPCRVLPPYSSFPTSQLCCCAPQQGVPNRCSVQVMYLMAPLARHTLLTEPNAMEINTPSRSRANILFHCAQPLRFPQSLSPLSKSHSCKCVLVSKGATVRRLKSSDQTVPPCERARAEANTTLKQYTSFVKDVHYGRLV